MELKRKDKQKTEEVIKLPKLDSFFPKAKDNQSCDTEPGLNNSIEYSISIAEARNISIDIDNRPEDSTSKYK